MQKLLSIGNINCIDHVSKYRCSDVFFEGKYSIEFETVGTIDAEIAQFISEDCLGD